MGLTLSGTTEGLAGTMQQVSDLWRTVGYDEVDGQPVKAPTDGERARLVELLSLAIKQLEA
jgi:hypothetical protein